MIDSSRITTTRATAHDQFLDSHRLLVVPDAIKFPLTSPVIVVHVLIPTGLSMLFCSPSNMSRVAWVLPNYGSPARTNHLRPPYPPI